MKPATHISTVSELGSGAITMSIQFSALSSYILWYCGSLIAKFFYLNSNNRQFCVCARNIVGPRPMAIITVWKLLFPFYIRHAHAGCFGMRCPIAPIHLNDSAGMEFRFRAKLRFYLDLGRLINMHAYENYRRSHFSETTMIYCVFRFEIVSAIKYDIWLINNNK